MSNFFEYLFCTSRQHVSDETLICWMDGELPPHQSKKVQHHLEGCWTCRAKRDQLEKTIVRFVGYRQQELAPFLPPPTSGRDRFLAKLDELFVEPEKNTNLVFPVDSIRRTFNSLMSPIFASALVVGIAALLLVMVWRNPKKEISSVEFLEHVQSASLTSRGVNGVIYQKVEIRNRSSIVERSIYRDGAGARKAVEIPLPEVQRKLRKSIEEAGVSWQEPLAAESFVRWHRGLARHSDEIVHDSGELLTLTTKTPDSEISEQSLTVRNTDFHPVARRITFRNEQTVEVAELTYDVLPWSAVNASALFEPLPVTAGPVPTKMPVPLRLPEPQELDAAELDVRLALNKAHAEAGEDIHVEVGRSAVRVFGVVDTDSRKADIESRLRGLAWVKPQIQSFEQLSRERTSRQGDAPTFQTITVDADASPLERFLKEKSLSQESGVVLSRDLFDSSLAIRQHLQVLDDLDHNFTWERRERLAEQDRVRLARLIESHVDEILKNLDREKSVIDPYLSVSPAISKGETPSEDDLHKNVQLNLRLCQELISNNETKTRLASQIFDDLADVASKIRSAAQKKKVQAVKLSQN